MRVGREYFSNIAFQCVSSHKIKIHASEPINHFLTFFSFLLHPRVHIFYSATAEISSLRRASSQFVIFTFKFIRYSHEKLNLASAWKEWNFKAVFCEVNKKFITMSDDLSTWGGKSETNKMGKNCLKKIIKSACDVENFPELSSIVLVGVLATVGIIILILILLTAAYFWWRHKRSQLEFVEPCDDHETSSASLKFQQLLETQQQEQLLEEQKKQQQSQQANTQTNKINSKLNGFLNLKTPLIGWVFCVSCHHFHKPTPSNLRVLSLFWLILKYFVCASVFEWDFMVKNVFKRHVMNFYLHSKIVLSINCGFF